MPVKALFVHGKGAHFWGPYTIHSRIPLAAAKVVNDFCSLALRRGFPTICSIADQAILSKSVAELDDSSLRSIRRGALVWFAQAGANDSQLQLLSGHRHRDTLMRYLGWGAESSEARQAAAERAALVAGTIGGGLPRHPTWVGPYAGFTGSRSGRRVSAPPRLFPLQPPSREAFGIDEGEDDPSTWPVHVKTLSRST